MLSDLAVSLIRTLVPTVAGNVVAWLLTQVPGVQIEPESLDAAYKVLTVACIGLYYAAARALERRYPSLGWLLGVPKQPVYIDTRRGSDKVA